MVSFIVLHYNNIEDTLKCLEHLKVIGAKQDANIIVVDNNTLNENTKKRILKYTTDIVVLDKNYGFAKANNAGITYAKKKYNPNFYCVINNDVFITQLDFIKEINNLYNTYHFDMLGPYISSPSGESVNPFPVLKNKSEVLKAKNKCEKLIKIYNSSILTRILFFYIKIKRIFKKPVKLENGLENCQNVALHGCAIIFSKKYINKYKDAFYNETFLYHEEEFLYYRMQKDNLISIYSPKIKVFHKEGSSLKNSIKDVRKAKLFREQERLKSLKLLLRMI